VSVIPFQIFVQWAYFVLVSFFPYQHKKQKKEKKDKKVKKDKKDKKDKTHKESKGREKIV
jgi:hypothetical protein